MGQKSVVRRGRRADPRAAAARREAILSSASRLFAAQGYAQTHVDRVAAELDIGKGTIYLYFRSKEDLFFAAVEREFGRLRDVVPGGEVVAGDPLGSLVAAVSGYLNFFRENPHAVELIMQARAAFPERAAGAGMEGDFPVLGKWRDLIQLLMDEAYLRPVSLDFLMEFLLNSLYGTVGSDSFRDAACDVDGYSRSTLDLLLRGMATEKALREWGLVDR